MGFKSFKKYANQLIESSEVTTSRKENSNIGLLCIPFAFIIDVILILIISNLTFSYFFDNLIFISITVFLAILLTRSAIVLIAFPDGLKNGNLIHPIILLLLHIVAFFGILTGLISYFGIIELQNNEANNSRGISNAITILLVLPFFIVYQFKKAFKVNKPSKDQGNKIKLKKKEKIPKRRLSRKRQKN